MGNVDGAGEASRTGRAWQAHETRSCAVLQCSKRLGRAIIQSCVSDVQQSCSRTRRCAAQSLYLYNNKPDGGAELETQSARLHNLCVSYSYTTPRAFGMYIAERWKLLSVWTRNYFTTRAQMRDTPPGWQNEAFVYAMVVSCCAFECRNRFVERPGLGFFRFPAVPIEKRKTWIVAVKRKGWVPRKHSRVCGDHFVSGICI